VAEHCAEAARKTTREEESLIFRTASIYDPPHRSFFERASASRLGPNRVQIRRRKARRGARRCRTGNVEDRMRRLAHIALLACLSILATAAFAFDNGQYENVPPDIRTWFKSVMAPNGVPCCDISDGHKTEYDFREGAYWVPIEGQWMAVPERAIIRDRGNPVGEAVVWYVHHRGSIIISCFVPADAV
jgi:hypothetical protein